ncbi:MAG: FecR domain-containing protein [Treponemataceae bacterium]|nr:FecR domain-containing protein [Treponemataceae bacterium]
MKKLICAFLILALAFTAVFAQNMKASVVSVTGKVERQIGEDWIPLNVGDSLEAGTLISTGFKSNATIKFDGSVLDLAPLSRLTLSQLIEQEGSRDSSVYLDAGKIKANIKSSDNKRVNFTVNSPVATASVRGTAGEVDVLGNVKSTESVWSVASVDKNGNVSKKVPVSKGMNTKVSTDGTVHSPVTATVQSNTGASALMVSASSTDSEFVANTFASDAVKSNADTTPSGGPTETASLTVTISIEE